MNSKTAVLYQAYLDQKAQYERAARLTASIHKEFEQARHPYNDLQQLNEIMAGIGESDKRIAEMRDPADRGVEMNDEIKQVINDLKNIVEHLLSQINVIEQLARASRQKLAPQISAQVRESRMLSAYSNR